MDAEKELKVISFASEVRILRMWIEHWQDDVASGLKPTETSLQRVRDDALNLEKSIMDFVQSREKSS